MKSALVFITVLCLWIGADASRCRNPAGNCDCPSGWAKFGCNCFKYISTSSDWTTAEKTCNNHGGNLASIQSADEYNFVRGLIRAATGSNTRVWVGAHDETKEGHWLWSDGTKFQFNLWGAGQPSNGGGTENCMELNWNNAPNDHQCYVRKPFICSQPL
ncbi:galactose-specific lectin nattectin-like [Synchiropus splendidus]|uniref:galactose-specific lectin nattectin-like n=1 Tax=Synchiropus splendidus TaxID=270530 RepID=UPI00237E0482|nr:galactose-specific lectin nattectin-like [Synchiropus splendidus]